MYRQLTGDFWRMNGLSRISNMSGTWDVAWAEKQADAFPLSAKDRGFEGLDWVTEGRWNGPFSFIQAADTQFGMMDNFRNPNVEVETWDKEIRLTQQVVAAANRLNPKPRFFVICGDLVDAMPGIACKAEQVRDLKAVLTGLDPQIRPVCVCGNHDIGDVPTPESIEQYRKDFGDDYFAFWVGGVKFVVINSQFYHDDSLSKQLSEQHDLWLDREIQTDPEKPWKHIVGMQHIPPFVAHIDEETVDVFGNPNLSFNFWNKPLRRRFCDRLKRAGMRKLFCGHWHRNGGGWDGDLEVVVTTAIGCQLGDDTHGVRVVQVLEDRIEHQYYPIANIPTHLPLC